MNGWDVRAPRLNDEDAMEEVRLWCAGDLPLITEGAARVIGGWFQGGDPHIKVLRRMRHYLPQQPEGVLVAVRSELKRTGYGEQERAVLEALDAWVVAWVCCGSTDRRLLELTYRMGHDTLAHSTANLLVRNGYHLENLHQTTYAHLAAVRRMGPVRLRRLYDTVPADYLPPLPDTAQRSTP